MNGTSEPSNPRDLVYQIELTSPLLLKTSDVPEPEEFATFHTGKIVEYDVTIDPIDVGRIAFDQIHIATAFNERMPVAEVFDALAYDESMHSLLDNESGWLDKSLAYQLGLGPLVGDIVIIQQLDVLPAYRGVGLAERVVGELFRRFCELALVVLKPQPRQFSAPLLNEASRTWYESLNLRTFSQDPSQAVRSLTGHFQRMGFTALEGRDLLVMPNPSLTLPNSICNRQVTDQRDQLH
jgi:ribosomal protein S18 acetylase RimI-like enzyme